MLKYLPTIVNSGINHPKINPISNTRLITSDHLSKINILHQYLQTSNKNLFCKQNLLNKNGVKRAQQIRDQLSDYLQQIAKERAHL